MNSAISSIISSVQNAERLLILSHNRPDGDAIGSAVGLALILEGIGKSVQVVNYDEVPEGLRFLPQVDRVDSPREIQPCDVVMALDSAGRDRIHDDVWREIPEETRVINIDHHISNTEFGDVVWVDSGSPATGQMIFQLADAAGWEVSEEAANLLYAAISTDTGSFRYPSTTSDTLRIVANLVDLGVNVGRINQQLYESCPLRSVLVLSRLLSELRLDCEGRCASVALPLSVTRELELVSGDTEGVIDVIRAIDSVMVAVFFEELEDGKIRVSSRSKSEVVSVSKICAEFGGGGHALAAGARLSGPMDEAADRFVSRVCQVILAEK